MSNPNQVTDIPDAALSRARERVIRDLLKFPAPMTDDSMSESIDSLFAEALELDHEGAAIHYACAVANWNSALDEVERLRAELARLGEDRDRLDFYFIQQRAADKGVKFAIIRLDGGLFRLDRWRTAEDRGMEVGDWIVVARFSDVRAAIDAARQEGQS